MLTEDFTSVGFDGITDASPEKNQSCVSGEVSVLLSEDATIIAAVYDAVSNELIGIQMVSYESGSENHDININCSFEHGRKYHVQLFVWKDTKNIVPFSTVYVIDLK